LAAAPGADCLSRAALHRTFQHLAADRVAVALAQQALRHLARPKPRQSDLTAELVEAAADLAFKFAGGNDDLELVFQAVGVGLGHLHLKHSYSLGDGPASLPRWCGRRDLNPHDFHRWNLNPVRLPIPPRPPLAPRAGRGAF
jgi:hypothetical protein